MAGGKKKKQAVQEHAKESPGVKRRDGVDGLDQGCQIQGPRAKTGPSGGPVRPTG